MYISDKFWHNYVGDTDDSLNLVAMLNELEENEVSIDTLFEQIGISQDLQAVRKSTDNLCFTNSDGVTVQFAYAINQILDCAAIMLECYVNGSVRLSELDDYIESEREINIVASLGNHEFISHVLQDFIASPKEYDICEMLDDDGIAEMVEVVTELHEELYNPALVRHNYAIKADQIKPVLTDWEGPDACIATSRVTVQNFKVGYCYREEPQDPTDSGWRFMAGNESEGYMSDPRYAFIYSLNVIANYDPEVLSVLKTGAVCAFSKNAEGRLVPTPITLEGKDYDCAEPVPSSCAAAHQGSDSKNCSPEAAADAGTSTEHGN